MLKIFFILSVLFTLKVQALIQCFGHNLNLSPVVGNDCADIFEIM